MQKEERRDEEREEDEVEEKAEEQEVRRDDGPVEQVHGQSTTAAEHLSYEPATSQQQPASDVVCDVSSVQGQERDHVTISRDEQLETPPTSGGSIEPRTLADQLSGSAPAAAERDVDEEMTSGRAAEVVEPTRLPAVEELQIREKSEAASDDVRTGGERAAADHVTDRCASEPDGHDDQQQQQPPPPPTSIPSSTATDAVARQPTVQSSSSPSTAVEPSERGKKRHRDDKSRRTEHSAEVSRSLAIVNRFTLSCCCCFIVLIQRLAATC